MKENRMLYAALAACVLAVCGLAACSSVPDVTRIDSDTVTDLSGYWNNTDVRIVCTGLIEECLNSPRVAQSLGKMGKVPVFLVGSFVNESDEHIDTAIIADNMELAIFNSGRADFVAGGDLRKELRAERQEQQGNASEETAKALAQEMGADFLLTGSVRAMVDRAGNQATRTYYVSARLTNLENNTLLWMGQNSEIKKLIKNPKLRF